MNSGPVEYNMNYGDNPDHMLRENGEDDKALKRGNDDDDHCHARNEEEEGGEGGGNGEDEEGGGKEVYQKQERHEGEQPEQANRTSGGRQLIEVRESK